MTGPPEASPSSPRARYPERAHSSAAYFISPYTEDSIPALKVASLYFDHVVLQQSAILATLPENAPEGQNPQALGPKAPMSMVDDGFLTQVRPLAQAGILSVRDIGDVSREMYTVNAIKSALRGLLRDKPGLIATESPVRARNERGEIVDLIELSMPREVRTVITKHYGRLTPDMELPLDFMYAYYAALLGESIYVMSEGHFALTGSQVLDSLMQYVLANDEVARAWATAAPTAAVAPAVAHELLQITLPDVSGLSFEDLLGARDRLGPELSRLRDAVSRLSHVMTEGHDRTGLLHNLRDEVNTHIVPAVEQLRAAIADSRYGLLVGLAASLKDPHNLVPLMGTLLAGLPAYVIAIASLAAAVADPIVQHVADTRSIASNGLYGLIRLDKQLRKWTGE